MFGSTFGVEFGCKTRPLRVIEQSRSLLGRPDHEHTRYVSEEKHASGKQMSAGEVKNDLDRMIRNCPF